MVGKHHVKCARPDTNQYAPLWQYVTSAAGVLLFLSVGPINSGNVRRVNRDAIAEYRFSILAPGAAV